jgi:hypothetical protein
MWLQRTHNNSNAADPECNSEHTPVTVPPSPTMKRPCVVLESVHTIHKTQEDASKDEEGYQLDDQGTEEHL